jgi:4-amino-4-deoxy-L-arabinose transferase-like glycosyltransferase
MDRLPPLTKNAKLLLTVAVGIGLAGRLIFSLVYWVDKPMTVDQSEYLMLAENAIDGVGLVYNDGENRLMRSPGYPVFLAGVLALWRSIIAVKIAQSVMGALSVLLIAALAYRLAGGRAAIVAAFVAALYPPLVWTSAYVLSETLFTFLTLTVSLVVWWNLDALRRARSSLGSGPTVLRFLAAGALTGVCVLTRPEFLLFLGLVGFSLIAAKRWTAALAMVVGTAIIVAPWTAHNYLSYQELVLVSSRGGPNFWLGNSALAPGDGGAGATPELSREYNVILRANENLSPTELEQLFYREAFAWIRNNPREWIVLEAKKFFYFWVPVGPSYSSHSTLYWVGQATSYLALLPFALRGFWRVVRQREQPIVLWVLAGVTLLTSVIFFPLPRYRIPMFDPVMIVCASVLIKNDQ